MRTRTATWFETKIQYEKTMEDGLQKKVKEQYVVDALSFTEAEKRITEEMSSYISGAFDVADIKKATYKENREGEALQRVLPCSGFHPSGCFEECR